MAENFSPNARITLPTSKFGTRELAHLVIGVDGIQTNYTDANSLYHKTIQALQQIAEIYVIGTPGTGKYGLSGAGTGGFVAVVAADTLPVDAQSEINDGSSQSTVIKARLEAGVPGSTFTVYHADLNGFGMLYND